MNMNETIPAALQAFFREHRRGALAFSGGCDSAYLLYAALACGVQLGVYYVHSPFQPAFELADARRLAAQLGCDMRLLELDVLAETQVRKNSADRCYHCKRAIMGAIQAAAMADGYDLIVDGTNFSDEASDRPGMRALQEKNILSPLRICQITKDQVREYSRRAGLFTWNKPAYACLATRIPAGMEIRSELLARVERAEDFMFKLGFSDFRVRITHDGARLEICESQLALLMEKRREIIAALEADFMQITLDLHMRGERRS